MAYFFSPELFSMISIKLSNKCAQEAKSVEVFWLGFYTPFLNVEIGQGSSISPYQGKSVVFTGDHTPLSISDIGMISLSSRYQIGHTKSFI